MEIGELYGNLIKAYTAENLGLVSGRIIELFREKKYDALRAIQKVVNEHTPCQEEKINKVFSRLIMLYHPDRLSQNREELEKAFREGDFEALYAMSHILTVQNLEPDHAVLSSVITEEDLAEEFGWDQGADGYSYFMAGEEFEQEEDLSPGMERRTFLSVLKRRVYGNLNVDFPMYLLEDLEEIEGSEALYRHIHRHGPKIGVKTIADLAGRIVDPDDHERLWVGYCQKWLGESNP